jgi:hypothetical protein
MKAHEAITAWQQDSAMLTEHGIVLPGVTAYAADEWKKDYTLAMDAQPALMTSASAGIPAMLTTSIDPNVIRVMFAPNKVAEIFGEVKRGVWTDDTILFPVIEQVARSPATVITTPTATRT